MNKNKCLEYYLDSRVYHKEEVQKSIEETKKEFPNKKIKVEITMNSFGMYVITFYFENRNNIFQKIRVYFRNKRRRTLLLQERNIEEKDIDNKKKINKRLEKYYGHKYGQYKSTGIYKPY